ncbi:hypothetical protein X798_04085 [Onchocerca flexuosa]|uniref:Uncharacterized protein n=1 Tax=Onchocerca flexuosa TaxID=387005 RepID=A0A238BU77_9BILA|nr:hypothetical protein X798_04085 [Onchocerca flexuosa]
MTRGTRYIPGIAFGKIPSQLDFDRKLFSQFDLVEIPAYLIHYLAFACFSSFLSNESIITKHYNDQQTRKYKMEINMVIDKSKRPMNQWAYSNIFRIRRLYNSVNNPEQKRRIRVTSTSQPPNLIIVKIFDKFHQLRYCIQHGRIGGYSLR